MQAILLCNSFYVGVGSHICTSQMIDFNIVVAVKAAAII